MTRKEMYKQCFEIFQIQFKELMKADEEEKALVLKFKDAANKYQREYYNQKRADAFKAFYEPYISKIHKRGDMLMELLENIKQDYLKDTVDLSDPKIHTAVTIASNNGFVEDENEFFSETNNQLIKNFLGNIPALKMLKSVALKNSKEKITVSVFDEYIFDPELEFETLKMNITDKLRRYFSNIPADLKWSVRKYAKMLENLAVKSGIGLTEKEMRMVDDELGFAFLQGLQENYSDYGYRPTANSVAAEAGIIFDSEGTAETGEAAEGTAE